MAAGILSGGEFHDFDTGAVGIVDIEAPFAVAPNFRSVQFFQAVLAQLACRGLNFVHSQREMILHTALLGVCIGRNVEHVLDPVRAVGDLKQGPDVYGGAGFRAALIGEPGKASNLRAALTELPNGARRLKGFDRFMDVLEATGYRPQTGSATDFNRAIREARGWQPEAHVGIGRVYEDKGEYELAAREFKIAVDQLFETEPIIYQMLGAAYEKTGNNRDAIAAYENYLRLAPNGSQASAVRSIVEQLKSQP